LDYKSVDLTLFLFNNFNIIIKNTQSILEYARNMYESIYSDIFQIFYRTFFIMKAVAYSKSGINVLSLRFLPIFAWLNSAEFQDKTADSIVKYQKLVK